MKYALLLLALLAIPLAAQPALDLSSKSCPGTQARILAAIPATVAGGAQVLVPVCLAIGAGLRFNPDAAGGPALEATAVAGPSLRMAADVIKLDDIPTDQPSLDYTLVFQPAAGSVLWAAYRGQTWWTQVFDIARPVGKVITVKLPVGRILQSGDALILMYLTYDPVRP